MEEKTLPQPLRLDAVSRNRFGALFCFDNRVLDPERKLRHPPFPVPLRLGFPLHRSHVRSPRLDRTPPLRRPTKRHISRSPRLRLRRPWVLITDAGIHFPE